MIRIKLKKKSKLFKKIADLTISDDGAGFPDHILNKLGDAEIRSMKPGGQGIGFLMAARTIKKYGGTISFMNQNGAVVRIDLNLP